MRKTMYATTILSVFIVLSGCLSSGIIQVTNRPGEKIDPRGRIHLKNISEDILGIQDKLEHRLIKAGFEVRPDIFVKSSDTFIASSRKAKSGVIDYSLEYEYSVRRTFLFKRLFVDDFNAKMLNLETGKTILVMNFKGRRSESSFLDELMSKMEEVYK